MVSLRHCTPLSSTDLNMVILALERLLWRILFWLSMRAYGAHIREEKGSAHKRREVEEKRSAHKRREVEEKRRGAHIREEERTYEKRN